jgi:hypothetical protein
VEFVFCVGDARARTARKPLAQRMQAGSYASEIIGAFVIAFALMSALIMAL